MSEPHSPDEYSDLEERLRQRPNIPSFSFTARRLVWVLGVVLVVLVLAWRIQNLLPSRPGAAGGSAPFKTTPEAEAKKQADAATPTSAPSPQSTASTSEPLWIRYQEALAAHFMPWIEDKEVVLCEWEIYGQRDAKVYLWALCKADEAHYGTGVSTPAVLHLGLEGEIQDVESPGDGTQYGVDIRRLFPPAAQKRIFAHDFDVKAAEANIVLRRQDPSIPPLAASAQAEPPPELAGAISAGEVDRLVSLAQWGQGEARQAFFSPDGGQLALVTSRGVTFFDARTWEQQRFLACKCSL